KGLPFISHSSVYPFQAHSWRCPGALSPSFQSCRASKKYRARTVRISGSHWTHPRDFPDAALPWPYLH
ncbi:hypothetical protein LEMLEM_LOCUS25414, partial [Lemmus lemmus]